MTTSTFTVTAGDVRMERATNPCSSGTWAFGVRIKIVTYANYGDAFGFFQSSSQFNMWEYDNTGGGRLVVNKQDDSGFAENAIWTDARTTWNDLIAYTSGTNVVTEYRELGGSWTAGPTIARPTVSGSPLAATKMHVIFPSEFSADGNGTIRFAKIVIYKGTTTQSTLRAEMDSRSLLTSTNVTFYNDCTGASPNVENGSSGDGNFTLTGTPTSNADDPWSAAAASPIIIPQLRLPQSILAR